MSDRNHSINHRLAKPGQAGPERLNVPKENIIDLRHFEKPVSQKNEPAEKHESHFLSKLPNIHWPTISWPSFRKKAHRTVSERVIISNTSTPLTGRASSLEKLAPPHKASGDGAIEDRQTDRPYRWQKPLLAFAVFCLIIVIPIYLFSFYHQASAAKGEVLGTSEEAYQNLKNAGSATSLSDYVKAGAEFSQAAVKFEDARAQLSDAGGLAVSVAKLVPNKITSADALLKAGDDLSQAGTAIASLVDGMADTPLDPLNANSASLSDFMVNIRNNLRPVNSLITDALDNLDKVRTKDLPSEMQPQISALKDSIPLLRQQMTYFYSVSDVMLQIMGTDSPKRYLIIFQNSRELRPTGGFMGSIALMDINKGKIEKLEVPGGGIYDVAGQLKEKLIAPKPLWLVNPLWNIQDSNWFPDFPTTARKIMWFYERTGGATVDGIITLTPQVIEKLIEITGPIDMQQNYGVTVDENNFARQAQVWAEITYDKAENKPKKFIGDLLPLLLNNVFQTKPDNLIKVVNAFNQSLNDQSILLYFSDEQVEKQITDLSWSGQIKDSDNDYLYVVATNIAGGKTDQIVNQYVTHHASIQKDGSIIDTVTITRTHVGNALDRWEGKTNVDYVRLYVPLGSKFNSATGFSVIENSRYILPDKDAVADTDLENIEKGSIIDETSGTRITNEFNKTVFGNWLSVDPGSTISASITYTLPWRLQLGGLFDKTDQYSLYVQKQPGIMNNSFTGQISVPDTDQVLWHSSNIADENGNYEYNGDLNTDKSFGILLKK
jgi:hypothetical protein